MIVRTGTGAFWGVMRTSLVCPVSHFCIEGCTILKKRLVCVNSLSLNELSQQLHGENPLGGGQPYLAQSVVVYEFVYGRRAHSDNLSNLFRCTRRYNGCAQRRLARQTICGDANQGA